MNATHAGVMKSVAKPSKSARIASAIFLVLLFAGAGQSDEALLSDEYTLACLTLEEPNPTLQACRKLYPLWAFELEEAVRKWEARNASERRTLKSACETRLSRVYGGDQARVDAARQQALEMQQAMLQRLTMTATPNAQADCKAFIRAYSEGTPKIDGDAIRKLIDAVRDNKP